MTHDRSIRFIMHIFHTYLILKPYQSQVPILGPVGYEPTTLPLRYSDICRKKFTACYVTEAIKGNPLSGGLKLSQG